jgi:hypothetical protein
MAGEAVDDVVIAAREVTAVDSLHLDDASTEIGQVPRCQRGGHGLFEGDDDHPVERKHAGHPRRRAFEALLIGCSA